MNTLSIKQKVRYFVLTALVALSLMTAIVVANVYHSNTSVGTTHQAEQMAGPDDDHGGG